MLIKFNESDPRAGTTVRMDSSRGQQLIDSGAASLVKDAGAEPEAGASSASTEPAAASVAAPAPAARKTTGKAKR